jgi:hypothetical protein
MLQCMNAARAAVNGLRQTVVTLARIVMIGMNLSGWRALMLQ